MRRLLLSIALAVSMSALYASPALARRGRHHGSRGAPQGAQKAPLFGPFSPSQPVSCSTGAEPTPKTFGFAVLNTPGDETTLSGEVALKHATPNATYNVVVVQGVCLAFTPVGEITTNGQGNGNLEFTTARNPAAKTFIVNVENTAAPEEFISPAVELD